MPVTLTTDEHRVIVLAVHEAAHAVVGTIYGAKVDHAVLAEDNFACPPTPPRFS